MNLLITAVLLFGWLTSAVRAKGQRRRRRNSSAAGPENLIQQHEERLEQHHASASLRGATKDQDGITRGLMKKQGKKMMMMMMGGDSDDDDDTPVVSCPDTEKPLAVEIIAANDYVEGNADQFGNRVMWYLDTLLDLQGNAIGYSSGLCTVVAQADTSADGQTHSLCDIEYRFHGGFLGSGLLFSGIYSSPTETGTYTITGGTGCYSGVSGTVEEYLKKSQDGTVVYGGLVTFQ